MEKMIVLIILALSTILKTSQGCFEMDKDSPGNDVGFIWNPRSAEECQNRCQQNSRCNFFLFKRNVYWIFNGCWLKSQKASNLRDSSGFILGPKSCDVGPSGPQINVCFTNHVNSPGNDIGSRMGISSAEQCQEICKNDRNCKYFVYGSSAFSKTCFLKSDKVAHLTQHNGLIFGPKSCACPSGTSTTPLDANSFASSCFGTPTSGKADPETTTKNNCKCKDQCRADVARNFAIEDSCNTEGGFFGQCGDGGFFPSKWDWCRYKASSKCNCVLQKWKTKEDAIWSAIIADQSFGNHPTWEQTSVGIMTQSMVTSMENEWDIVPAGRKKFIHYIAAACKFTLDISNSPFTGVFKNGVQQGLLRMGSATWVDPFPLHGCVPGVSIKFFRSYRSSADFFAMNGIDALPDGNHNFFCCNLTNHNPSPQSPQNRVFAIKFGQASSCITKVGLADAARYDQDGNEATNLVFPYKITLKPTGNVQFSEAKPPTLEAFQRQFKDLITPGMAIYDFHAHTDPNDVNGLKLGQMVIPNRCVDKSKFADERLWFQHHRIEEDIALKPEWKDKYEEVC